MFRERENIQVMNGILTFNRFNSMFSLCLCKEVFSDGMLLYLGTKINIFL